MYYTIIIVLAIILIYLILKKPEHTSDTLSRIALWKNSLPDDSIWWDNVKKSGQSLVLE
jgi:hypothetical protein